MENGIKVGPNGQITTLLTHLPNMYQRGLKPASQDCDTRTQYIDRKVQPRYHSCSGTTMMT